MNLNYLNLPLSGEQHLYILYRFSMIHNGANYLVHRIHLFLVSLSIVFSQSNKHLSLLDSIVLNLLHLSYLNGKMQGSSNPEKSLYYLRPLII